MRRNRTGPATTPASGEGPGSSVVMACVGHEREQAAERAATGGGRGVGLLVGGQAASTVGDACYAVALPWYVLTGHGGAAALGTTLAAYGIAAYAHQLQAQAAHQRAAALNQLLAESAIALGTMAAASVALGWLPDRQRHPPQQPRWPDRRSGHHQRRPPSAEDHQQRTGHPRRPGPRPAPAIPETARQPDRPRGEPRHGPAYHRRDRQSPPRQAHHQPRPARRPRHRHHLPTATPRQDRQNGTRPGLTTSSPAVTRPPDIAGTKPHTTAATLEHPPS